MLVLGVISDTLLYLCFALLIGSFLLYLVPAGKRPDIHVPKGVLMAATGGIAIFSFIPVLSLILHLYQDIGLSQTTQSVLFTFEIGKAWIFTYLISNILFIYIVWFDYRKKQLYAYVGIFFTVVLILALGYSSHATSIVEWKGFLTHTSHFTAISVWVGILIIVSWFSKDHSNWLRFLKWFTPVAMVCFTVTIISGLILMSVVTDFKDYTNAWMIPYGQALLIKHLLIVPLLVYATMNSLFIKNKLRSDENFNPKPWTKIESVVILLIFSATAAMGQQSPPHETLVTDTSVSKLFKIFYQGEFQPGMTVQLILNTTSVSLIILSVLFLVLALFTLIKKAPAMLSFCMSILFVLSSYLSLIISIQ
ncbi:copper resistance D family protein [Bacillus canaveralius]|uniref:copper resistance D family protein n=1 Tax=Bacillus canaveralius TaxID=1403243 RepID=UPI000F776D36|nr:CopD family protein [Bacillus canaveralius]RSK47928.1 copper resistance protein CopD [Bacillus canaveralius]